MTLRELLARSSPVTLGLLVVNLLVLGGRLASARPTTPPLRPTATRPLVVDEGQTLRDLEVLSPTHALAVHQGRASGGSLLDWSRSGELDGGSPLSALAIATDRTARRADQIVVLDGQPVTVSGQRNYAWRYQWDVSRDRARRERLPDGFLWLTDEGEIITEDDLERPEGWPEPFPPSIVMSGHLALARPMVNRPGKSPRKGAAATQAADRSVMLFDRQSGRARALVDTLRIRRMFPVVGGAGFAWTDDTSCWLKYATCDLDGRCRDGTSRLRAIEPIFSASIRQDLRRIAVCSTRHVIFHEGVIDGDVRFLGRAPIPETCRKVVLTSATSAAAMLEDRSWVSVSMEPSR